MVYDTTMERTYLSQYLSEDLIHAIHIGGVLADPDGDEVTVTFDRHKEDGTNVNVFTDESATKDDVGLYSFGFTSAHLDTIGYYSLLWEYQITGDEHSYVIPIEVGQANPTYDNLPIGMKAVIETIWVRFADLFDSALGGPHLQHYYQTHWSRGRVAEMLGIALRKLNVLAAPHASYTEDNFPLMEWQGLLEALAYIECIKHLRRSYSEQPVASTVSQARLDRTSYFANWGSILKEEQDEAQTMLDEYKKAHMGLSVAPRVTVGGGVYGRFGPTRLPHSASARPRYYARFY